MDTAASPMSNSVAGTAEPAGVTEEIGWRSATQVDAKLDKLANYPLVALPMYWHSE